MGNAIGWRLLCWLGAGFEGVKHDTLNMLQLSLYCIYITLIDRDPTSFIYYASIMISLCFVMTITNVNY